MINKTLTIVAMVSLVIITMGLSGRTFGIHQDPILLTGMILAVSVIGLDLLLRSREGVINNDWQNED